MSRRKKLIYPVLGLLLVIVAAFGVYYFVLHKNNNPKSTTLQPSGTINYDPPTEEDKKRADANKEAIEKRDAEVENKPTTGGSTQNKEVSPVITYAGQYGSGVEVGSYVNGIYEEGGTCTVIFTNGSTTFSRSVNSVKSAKSTDCPAVIVSTQDFNPRGTWKVTVKYESPTSHGVSAVKEVVVK